uniref:Ankyrin repeat protein n=1 Tax=Lotharella oceanica TaxID=641309 RepID=A0A7S2XDW3_9EUKA|mmetsp:Transcript_33670/g.62556  ORF Transcript_33670/g.62556 Transcript_33670/m.62556 type:complete len:252 (+) Transcript_33670:75-830(+)
MVYAARDGDLETVKTMLARGVSVNAKDDTNGYTALIWGACNCHLKVVQYLVEDAKANVNAMNKYGWTALIHGARNGHSEVVQHLVEAKADVNYKDDSGMTALIFGLSSCNLEVVKYLIEDAKSNFNAQANIGPIGQTALMYGAASGDLKVVQYLVDAKANVNAKDNDGQTALIHAARSYQILDAYKLVLYLIDEANANVNAKDNSGKTALVHAASIGSGLVVDYLKATIQRTTSKLQREATHINPPSSGLV